MIHPTMQSLNLPPHISRDFIAPEECLCLVLDNILSKQECEKLIAKASPFLQSVSKTRGLYAQASQSKTEYHLSVIQDYEFTDKVWSRILPLAGPAIEKFVEREPGIKAAVCLTHRIRLLRYQGADRFDPHFDRIVSDEEKGQESLITVLIYLNDGGGVEFDGGETVFLDSKDPLNDKTRAAVVPKVGRVVLFEHGLYHAGLPLRKPCPVGLGSQDDGVMNDGNAASASIERGAEDDAAALTIAGPPTKYVIRTDVMFPMRPAWAR